MEHKLLTLEQSKMDVDDSGYISGYGSVFDTVDLGGDVVVKGAFSKFLKTKPSIKMLWGHDQWSPPIGVWSGAEEDEKGLKMSGRIFLDTERGKEVYTALKAGALDGLSIGYETVRQKKDGNVRKLLELKAFEVSIVNFPMNEVATVETVKTAAEIAAKKRNLEKVLRDAGLTKAQATHGASMLVEDVLGERDASNATAAMADEMKRFIRDICPT